MELKIDGLEVKYGNHKVLNGVSFTVGEGEVVGLVGPNGSGKSTLIRCIAQIHKPSHGTVLLNGRDALKMEPGEIARVIGYVPQNFHYLFFSTVMETVMLGRKPHIKWRVTPHDLAIVQQSLEAMNIRHLADKFMDQLSGGEKQKVYIARALAQEPELFLFDEPTSNLDLKHQIEVLEITRSLTRTGKKSMIVALHDLNLAVTYCDKIVVLTKGKVYAAGKPEEILTPQTIKDVYGVDVFIVESSYGRHILPIKARA